MGVSCLSKPITDKYSTDEANRKLNCGMSSMQGWREDQEDTHNCILDYDEDTSYFAVYDGHGGVEVAKYCSDCLPGFLKEIEDYKNGKIEKALEDAFLQFDATITTSEIDLKLREHRDKICKCRAESKINYNEGLKDGYDDEKEEENVRNLLAAKPLKRITEKYKAQNILNNATTTDKHSDSLPNNSSTSDDESPVSSSSQSKQSHEIKSGETKTESKVDSPDSSGDAKEECTPSDDTNANKLGNQNGIKTESMQNCESTKSDITSSITAVITPQGNGEVIKKGKSKKVLTKTREVVPKPEAEDNSDESSIDDQLKKHMKENYAATKYESLGERTGCTGLVALLKGYDLYVANAGDSRCVVCRSGQAIEMSLDHKPCEEPEYNRILKAGTSVCCRTGRLSGGLNLSRAIGDFSYKNNKDLSDKEQAVTALPDVKTLKIKPGEDEFMILACDGIWNSMSSQEVVDYVRVRMQEGREKLSQICEELFDHCLAPNQMDTAKGCDNMTAIIVKFKPISLKRQSTYESEHCKQIKIEEPQEGASPNQEE